MFKKPISITLMLFLSVAISSIALTFTSSPAQAGIVVGPGGGGGGGYATAFLVLAGDGKPGTTSSPSWAYRYFMTHGKYAPGNTVNMIKSGDVNKCKQSEYIWFVGNGPDGANGKASLSNQSDNQKLWRGQLAGGNLGTNFDTDIKKYYKVSGAVSTYVKGKTAYACSWSYQTEKATVCGEVPNPVNAVYKGSRRSSSEVPASSDTSTAKRQAYCFLKCPTLNSGTSINSKYHWVVKSRSGRYIPKGGSREYNSATGNSARGAYCASRPNVYTSMTATAIRSSSSNGKSNDDNGAGYVLNDVKPYAWLTQVLWDTDSITGTSALDWKNNNPGGDNFNLKEKQTAWGALTDKQLSSSWGANDKALTPAQVNAALTKDANTDHPDVKLGNKNQQVMARGGVLSTVETTQYMGQNERRTKMFKCNYTKTNYWKFTYTLYATYSMTAHTKDNSATLCPPSRLPSKITASNKNVDNYGNWKGKNTDIDIYRSAGTPEVTAGWQALSAHCNADGYLAASPNRASNGLNTPITQVNNGDNNKNWSGSSITATLKGTSAQQRLVWGNPGVASSKKHTDKRGTFDKECAFNGVRKGGEVPASTTHFRNNELSLGKTGVDLFVPRNEGSVVDYKNEPILSTTATRWMLGTPYANGVTPAGAAKAGGNFRMARDENGKYNFFNGHSTNIKGQKNFSVDPFASEHAGLVTGAANKFYVAATWASQKAAPQVLTFKYEYAPTVNNTFPVILGFDKNSNQEYTLKRVGAEIQGKLYAKPGSATSPAVDNASGMNLFAMQREGTGSSLSNSSKTVPNTADANHLPFGSNIAHGKWKANPRNTSPYYRVLKFVRATTE